MILTDDEIRKAAEFAAEQMWPESGYVGWTEDDAEFFRKFTDALIDKLRGGVELPEALEGVLDAPKDTAAQFWSCSGGVYEAHQCSQAITIGQQWLKEQK